jgi:hypothetical protein
MESGPSSNGVRNATALRRRFRFFGHGHDFARHRVTRRRLGRGFSHSSHAGTMGSPLGLSAYWTNLQTAVEETRR